MSDNKNSNHGDGESLIHSIDDPKLDSLCAQLRECEFERLGANTMWPRKQLELIGSAGVYRWFVPSDLGGAGWSAPDIVAGYIRLSSACLTSTFIVTQRVAALKRICGSENAKLKDRLLPDLLSGHAASTVGISHLTTSRQHVKTPALQASEHEDGFLVNGFSPWVTGACDAKDIVMGAQFEDGRQILFTIPGDAKGVSVEPGFHLVGLTASQTGPVKCENVKVNLADVIAGPCENVLATVSSNSTGGFQTSALALGLSRSAIDFIGSQLEKRPNLNETHESLLNQFAELEKRLIDLASGFSTCSNEELRSDANSLVLRATQSALVTAKGSGYVEGHPVGRWCREALFFLVWSCPLYCRTLKT